jgi:hypothetical protein
LLRLIVVAPTAAKSSMNGVAAAPSLYEFSNVKIPAAPTVNVPLNPDSRTVHAVAAVAPAGSVTVANWHFVN